MRNFSQSCHKFVAASVLVLTLTCAAFAGEMPLPGITSPPPTSATGTIPYPGVTSPETLNGEVQYPGVDESTITETALYLLQGALSLF
jgi:hypothetical protein